MKVFKIHFQFKFKNSDKIWEHNIYYSNEEIMKERYNRIIERYSMYNEFKIRVKEIIKESEI